MKLSYVDQNRAGIDPKKTVWQVVSDGLDHIKVGQSEMPSRAYVAAFGFLVLTGLLFNLNLGLLTEKGPLGVLVIEAGGKTIEQPIEIPLGDAKRPVPPAQVIDAFRDVQAASTDKERFQNEAASYANRIVPEARGDAERILQGASGYREQTVAEATGQVARFLKIYDEYKKAPGVTRTRMYLETMERVLGGSDKIIIDTGTGQGVVPFLSLDLSRKDGGK